MDDQKLLEVRNLRVTFNQKRGPVVPVRSVSFSVFPGERVALVGESGCGKSMTAMALTRLSPTDDATLSGAVLFEGEDLLLCGEKRLREVRGRRISYVFQDPTASLNPVMRIYEQVTEMWSGLSRRQRIEKTETLLAQTGLPDPARAARGYSCELSGGQRQRVMLAMALAAEPSLLVADEPTTALDVTTQQQVLDLMDSLSRSRGMALLLITHNLGLVAGRMDRVYVMYGGGIVESGPVEEVLRHPRHPYTKGLLAAVPLLDAPQDQPLRDIPGTVPSPDDWPTGCVFAPRCSFVEERCCCEEPGETVGAHGHCWRCWKGGD